MKQFRNAALAVLALPGVAFADPVFSTWASAPNEDGDAVQVEISACGAKVCGVISKVLGSSDTSAEGARMIWDMEPKGNGEYAGGKVWAPDSDRTFRGKMALSGDALKISGCVMGGAICRGSNFFRG